MSSDAKAGKDAAELVGLADSTGVKATKDLEAVLASEPQCAVYTRMADNRLPEASRTTAVFGGDCVRTSLPSRLLHGCA